MKYLEWEFCSHLSLKFVWIQTEKVFVSQKAKSNGIEVIGIVNTGERFRLAFTADCKRRAKICVLLKVKETSSSTLAFCLAVICIRFPDSRENLGPALPHSQFPYVFPARFLTIWDPGTG